jgi:phospholipid/cholesterol/gamma-HCH transport system ATP-binding protein
VVVSHDVEEISRIADLCYVVSGGQVIGVGTPAELERSESPLIRQFMSGEADGPVPFHYPAEPYEQQLLGGAK